MNPRCLTLAIAVICSTATALAQSPTGRRPIDANTTAKDGAVVVTGCVAASPDGKGYMLNDAIMVPPPAGKVASGAGVAGAPGDKVVLSYMLEGGSIKSHVGHKV